MSRTATCLSAPTFDACAKVIKALAEIGPISRERVNVTLGYARSVTASEQNLVVRQARAGEAASLSALAMRSKAHWGYSKEFLEVVRPLLTFSETDLTSSSVYVLEGADEPAGVYRLSGRPPQGELDDLWLDPRLIGVGAGRRLFEHALQTATELGFDSLHIESDPNAEGFYLAMGATRIGERRSQSGRTLPLLRIAL